MSTLGKVRIGHRAPDFRCEAVIKGAIEVVSLGTYIQPPSTSGTPNPDAPWLILLFIPAAFSFVCPTEVLAFQNCLEEFQDRNCQIIFVSVDTKHSLWHWQNVPRQYGGLGMIDIPLLSDSTHRLSRDYGVLIEEGVSLRGMFIIDGQGIVQQVTLNNLTVGRSVLEALRLLEAFQAVARHGVLCPIDWKPTKDSAETIDTISNTLTESYEERLANLQKEFDGVPVTDLDAKHNPEDKHTGTNGAGTPAGHQDSPRGGTPTISVRLARSHSSPQSPTKQEATRSCPGQSSPMQSRRNNHRAHANSTPPAYTEDRDSFTSAHSASAPESGNNTPAPTPNTSHPPSFKRPGTKDTARHSRGTNSHHLDPTCMSGLFSQSAPSMFHSILRRISSSGTDSSSGHSTASPAPSPLPKAKAANAIPTRLALQNTYESRRGSHVILEFADPTASPPSMPTTPVPPARRPLSRSISYAGPTHKNGWSHSNTPEPGDKLLSPPGVSQTRLQATFEALKKMGNGLASPRLDYSPRKTVLGGLGEEGASVGYFDGAVEVGGGVAG